MPGRIEPVRSRTAPKASNSGSSDSITENTDSYSATSTTWPTPRLAAVLEREHRADDAVERGQRVADRHADARRRPIGRAGDVAQAAHRLADHAEPRPRVIRARSGRSPEMRTMTRPGFFARERRVVQPPRLRACPAGNSRSRCRRARRARARSPGRRPRAGRRRPSACCATARATRPTCRPSCSATCAADRRGRAARA